MRRWLWPGAVAAGGIAAAILFGIASWNLETSRIVTRLRARRQADAPPFVSDELAGLPAPVVRYFKFALTPGQPLVSAARFRQIGRFAVRANSWSPFTAVEYFSVRPRGFLWDARIRMARFIPFFVRDSYRSGEGSLYGALAALVPVVNQRGTPDMASGELLRYLAEGPLLPTALLPREGVFWKGIDEDRACATLTDGPTTVSCEVLFSVRGEIVRISAMRNRLVNGQAVPTPWIGHWSDYRRINGMMIPTSGQAEWVLPDGVLAYWQGSVKEARFTFAP